MLFVELPILDPLLSIGFTLFILFNVFKNLKSTLVLFLQAAPDKETQERIKQSLIEFPEVIKKCVQTLEPQNISNYLSELASSFHSYYAKTRVIDSSNIERSGARIYLINATRIVLRNGLNILGVSSPEKM